jgi:hypothetical protein
MTDDQLERALLALPLEPAPPGLRDRILASTIYRVAPQPAFRAWEIWVLSVAVALVAVVTYVLLASVPDLDDRSRIAVMHALHAMGLFSVRTYAWFAVGVSTVWAISSLTLMPRALRTVYNR